MSPDEAEAVIAHEISHIANGDMVTMTPIQGVVNTFVIFISRNPGAACRGFNGGNRDEGEESNGNPLITLRLQRFWNWCLVFWRALSPCGSRVIVIFMLMPVRQNWLVARKSLPRCSA